MSEIHVAAPKSQPYPEGWTSWDYVLEVLLVAFSIGHDIGTGRLLRQWRDYGYIGSWRLLGRDELPENGVEGFFLQFCRAKQGVCFIKRADGSLYAKSTVACVDFKEASVAQPNFWVLREFDRAIEYLLLN